MLEGEGDISPSPMNGFLTLFCHYNAGEFVFCYPAHVNLINSTSQLNCIKLC